MFELGVYKPYIKQQYSRHDIYLREFVDFKALQK
jgi:hypothetical protein